MEKPISPKEKAWDLIYEIIAVDEHIGTSSAIILAIMMVDKVINSLPKVVAALGYGSAQFDNPAIHVWTNVKNELEKIQKEY